MTLALPAGPPGGAADVVLPRVADGESRFPPAEPASATRRPADVAAPDIVDEWGRGSFPASDPPANW